jgi:hypothetical protein
MKRVHFFEEKCCAVSVAEPLVKFLRDELGDAADVRVFDLSHPEPLTPLPPSLFFKLVSEGSQSLPAMAVDSVIVTEGWLPDRAEILGIVASGKPAARAALDSAACCCGPSAQCC